MTLLCLKSISFLIFFLGSRINCNIFSYDYSGYGASNGAPSEKNLYADIDAAWNYLRTKYGISPENIILYGQSIGTVPTVDLGSRYRVNTFPSLLLYMQIPNERARLIFVRLFRNIRN